MLKNLFITLVKSNLKFGNFVRSLKLIRKESSLKDLIIWFNGISTLDGYLMPNPVIRGAFNKFLDFFLMDI